MYRYIYKVGRTMFEADQLPQHLVEHCNLFDEIWVPSEFNRQTFAASGVKVPIFILPEVWQGVIGCLTYRLSSWYTSTTNLSPFESAQGVNTTIFHPDSHSPLSIVSLPSTSQVSGKAAGGKGTFVFLSIFKWLSR